MRMFVIGNTSCVLGFSLVGVDGRTVRDAAQLEGALDAATADDTVGLLLVTTDVAQMARERMDKLKAESMAPLVVEIPGEEPGPAGPSLRDSVQRAVGVGLGGS